MTPDLAALHERYRQQAVWTAAIRSRLFKQVGLRGARRVLEVGSGTGVITSEIADSSRARVYGLDVEFACSSFASRHDRETRYLVGRGELLPFPSERFDAAVCHFLLLWVSEADVILREMCRVTRTGGAVLCMAEPDYGGRIDYPPALEGAAVLQESALRRRSAETRIGRRLRKLLHEAGLRQVQVGVLGGEWTDAASRRGQFGARLEWETLVSDLGDGLTVDEASDLKRTLAQAESEGSHILFVPTFYGWGIRPAGASRSRSTSQH